MQGKSPLKSYDFIINGNRDFLSKIVHLLWFLVKLHKAPDSNVLNVLNHLSNIFTDFVPMKT